MGRYNNIKMKSVVQKHEKNFFVYCRFFFLFGTSTLENILVLPMTGEGLIPSVLAKLHSWWCTF